MFAAGKLDRIVRVERPVPDTSLKAAGRETWHLVTRVWARVEDIRPSRADRLDGTVDVTRRPARIIIRWRDDVQPGWRFTLGERSMKIVAGPVELGRQEGAEFLVEDFRPGVGGS